MQVGWLFSSRQQLIMQGEILCFGNSVPFYHRLLKLLVLLISVFLKFLYANRQLVQGNLGNVSTTLQQLQARNQQTAVTCYTFDFSLLCIYSYPFISAMLYWLFFFFFPYSLTFHKISRI